MKNRNAVLDLCRFLFASIVLLFHIAIIDNGVDDHVFFSINTWNVTFFYKGFLGVEFFFLVSGFFWHIQYIKKEYHLILKPHH